MPCWVALGVQEHYPHYGHIANIYEGSNEGKGLIKTLRSLSPNSIKDNWQYKNHLCVFYWEDFLTKKVGSTFGAQPAETEEPDNQDGCAYLPNSSWRKFRRYATDAEVTHPISAVVSFFKN
jgi:hypothetical protein